MATNTHRTGGARGHVSPAHHISKVQLAIAAVAIVAAAAFGAGAALSAAWGAGAGVAGTAYFARRVFGPVPRGPQAVFAGSMVRAGVVRVALSATLLAAAFEVMDEVVVPALVGAFLIVHVGGGLAALAPGSGSPQARDREPEHG